MRRHPIRWHQFFHLCRNLYAEADALVTVSQGVATDLIEIVGLRQDTVRVLPNPVIEPELPGKAAVSLEHSWLAGNTSPVLLAVGRLSPEKNYPMLMRTVALLKRRMTVRLVIIGEGQERVRLEDMRDKLGLTDDVLLPGWDDNPYRWMSRASVVVMCSDWEGLPTVLIEAMACGTPVVSTDCPHGPREILENGRYGELVPVDNEELLACAIERTIQAPVDKKTLVQSAQRYSVEASRSAFLDLANELIATV
jgi:glycosyltransferase involved in cell wall biosynthesis